MISRLLGGTLVLAWIACGSAQAAGFQDEAFADAVGSLMVTDTLKAQCPQAANGALAERLRTWERQNRIADLRTALTGARREPGGEARFQQLNNTVPPLTALLYGRGCQGLEAWLAKPEAALAGKFDGGRAPKQTPAPPARQAAGAAPAAAPAASAKAGDGIHGYGLIQTYGTGYGGMLTVKFTPVVLFKSGEILTDITGMGTPGGPAADRRANPRRWSRWRQTGAIYEYQNSSGTWKPINGNKVWSTPTTTALSGRYVSTGGGGNLAVGGTSAVFVERGYRFQPGGRVIRDGFSSSSASSEGGGSQSSTIVRSRPGEKPGRYAVDGLTMTIAYDDGTHDQVTLMTHPSEPDIIWINGEAYTRDR